jgi:hypothetical protein
MSTSDDYDDVLKTIYWVGWIMLATPILLALPPQLHTVITGQDGGVDGGAYAVGSMTLTGFIIMIYTSIKMARRKPSDTTRSN